jgi:two-component system cell cycle sensor histidine kinase/response regulator CckA
MNELKRVSNTVSGNDSFQAASKGLRILIADDVQENLDLLEDVLAENGYSTIMVRNGVEALERLRTETVHLIIADAMMPKMDGFQLCKEVKGNPALARIPFVIYTANYIDREDEDLAQSIGVDKYVVKYAGLGSLIEAVNQLCRLRYGYTTEETGHVQEQIDDVAFLEKHHAILVRKLEEKIAESEMYAETLSRKNRELQASELRYRSLFEQASIAILIIDRTSSRVLDVNKEGIALLGYSRDELLALPEFTFDGTSMVGTPLLGEDGVISGETAIRTKNDDIIAVEVSAVTFTQAEDHRIMLFMRDISEERRMRQQLLQGEKMMMMGALAAGIAHDIRNPLAAISINLQYLLQRLGDEGPEHEALDSSLEGTRRIEEIIENTLNLARLSPPALKKEDVNAIVNRSLWFTRIPSQQKHLHTEVLLADNLPLIVADPQQIQQVLLNLLQNAIDASPSEGTLTICTRLDASDDASQGKSVVVCIRDEGSGIPPEKMDQLFKPFFTTKVNGTGLGLALSHHIMQQHGGEIRVESTSEGGTTMNVVFPIHSQEHGGTHVEG